jgi:hypothetical protein
MSARAPREFTAITPPWLASALRGAGNLADAPYAESPRTLAIMNALILALEPPRVHVLVSTGLTVRLAGAMEASDSRSLNSCRCL